MKTTFEQVKSAFPNGEEIGGEWVTLCIAPGHNDRNHPNLHIKVEDDKLLANCNAGCPQAAVFSAVCARLRSQFPSIRNEAGQPEPDKSSSGGWGYTEAQLREAESRLEQASTFLASRGITIETARKLRFGYEYGRIVIPYFVDGQLAAVKMRAINPSGKDGKWKKHNRDAGTHWLFNRQTLNEATFADDVFVTESELDAAMLESNGFKAISVDTAGHQLNEADKKLLKSFSGNLVIAPDTDKPGINCAQKLIDALEMESAVAIKSPKKDLGELYELDPR
jgi:hypothetical protein